MTPSRTRRTASIAMVWAVCVSAEPGLHGQGVDRSAMTGQRLYQAACTTCHGSDGRGAPRSFVGFDTELPDFTDCKFSSPEADLDWMSIISMGGPVRAFDRKMPAFADALSEDEIVRIVNYIREFCTEPGWPRGDLNLPRPLVTEKAFPENEAVLTTSLTPGHQSALEHEFVYEHRVGRRGQYEVVVPLRFQHGVAGGWNRGLGDIAVAFKHVLLDSLGRGSILSAGSEVVFPTGKETQGLGSGLTVFEPFGTFSQALPHDGFLHLHAGFELPIHTDRAHNEAFWRAAVGKTYLQGRWGRAWSPMVELLGARALADREKTHWDLLPELQVTLSTRQHIIVNAGLRIPLNERSDRRKTVMVYLLWDWFDGGFFSGW